MRKKKEMLYFKILRDDLTNLAMLGATRMQYRFNVWNRPLEPLCSHPKKGGGLWATKNYKGMLRDLCRTKKHQGLIVRVFSCRAEKGLYEKGYLYESSCRIKSRGLFFTPQDEILRMKIRR